MDSKWLRVCVSVACCLSVVAVAGCEKKYPGGRDTVASFGDGRFQIIRLPGGRYLHDSETSQSITGNVREWIQDGDMVYLVNGDGEYVVLNHRMGSVSKFVSIDKVPPGDRDVCGKLNKNGFRAN